MKVLIFRTNIKTKKAVKQLKSIFKQNSMIKRWTVDTEDIDNVLRIEARGHIQENDIIRLFNMNGLQCEILPD